MSTTTRFGPPHGTRWGLAAATSLALVAVCFTLAIGFGPLAPLTALSAFLTELLAWHLLVTRREDAGLVSATAVGVVAGSLSHLVLGLLLVSVVALPAVGAGVATLDAPLVAEYLSRSSGVGFLVAVLSALFTGWFTVPASVLVTVGVTLVARRVAAV